MLKCLLISFLVSVVHYSFGQFEVELFSSTRSPATDLIEVHALYYDPSVIPPRNSDFEVSNAEIVRLLHGTETPELYSQTYLREGVYDFAVSELDSITRLISTGYEKRRLKFYDGDLFTELELEDCLKCNEFEIFEDTIYIISAERGEIRKYDYDGNTLDTLSIKRTSISLRSRRTKIQNNQIFYLTYNGLFIYNLSGSLIKVIGDTTANSQEINFTDFQLMDNMVYISDSRDDRIMSYLLDGSYSSTIDIENLSPRSFQIVDQSIYYLALERLGGEYLNQGIYVSDLEGRNVNKLFIPSNRPFMYQVVGGKEGGVFAQIGDGRFVDYRISNKSKSTIYLNPLADGVTTISLPEGALSNSDGLPNEASNTFAIVSDISIPTAILEFNENFDAEISIYLSFSESVTLSGDIYDAFDLHGANITRIDSLSTDGKFEIFLEPTIESGEIRVSFKENRVGDSANNWNSLSEELVIPYFPRDIIVTLDADTIDFQMKDTVDIEISFSDVVSPLRMEDIELSGGYILESSFSAVNDSSYQMSIITPPESEIFIGMEASRLFNTIGIGNEPLPFHFFVKDRTRPEIELALDDQKDLPLNTFPIIIRIDDPVFDLFVDPIYCLAFPSDCFGPEDVSVSGGYISDFLKVADGLYKCDLISDQGFLEISIAENLMFNVTGLRNIESNILQIGEPVLGVDKNPIRFGLRENALTFDLLKEQTESLVKVIDLEGRVIQERMFFNQVNEMDISHLQEGIYILTIQYNHEIFITRFKK